MLPVLVVAGFLLIALIFLLLPKKPLEANVSSDEEILKIAQTNKIEAIKEFRALYGVGLKDAKDAVERMMSSQTEAVQESDEEKLERVKRYISQGNTIAAIKEYRALYGVGLKEAKEAVERMM